MMFENVQNRPKIQVGGGNIRDEVMDLCESCGNRVSPYKLQKTSFMMSAVVLCSIFPNHARNTFLVPRHCRRDGKKLENVAF